MGWANQPAKQAPLSALEQQLGSMINSGNYSGAFQLANQNGALGDLYNPTTLSQIVGPSGMSQSDYSSFMNAFAPYEAQLSGTADPEAHGDFGIGTAVWGSPNNPNAVSNAQTESSNMQSALAQFGQSPQKTNLQQAIGPAGDATAGWSPNKINGVSGMAANVPDLQSAYANSVGNSTWDNIAPAVTALGMVVGPALGAYMAGADGAGDAAGAAATSDAAVPSSIAGTDWDAAAGQALSDNLATSTVPVTADSVAPDLGAATASTSAGIGGTPDMVAGSSEPDLGLGDASGWQTTAQAGAPADTGMGPGGLDPSGWQTTAQAGSTGSSNLPSWLQGLLGSGSTSTKSSPLSAILGLTSLAGALSAKNPQPTNFTNVPGSAISSYNAPAGSAASTVGATNGGANVGTSNPYSYMNQQYGFQPRMANPAMNNPNINWETYGQNTAAQNGGGNFFIPQSPLQIANQTSGAMPAPTPAPYYGVPMSGDPGPGQLLVMASGGALHEASDNFVRGPGTGRSDDIPALLSNGEYVMDAETVSHLGDGSNEAGAEKLDRLRENIRKHKGGALARGEISPDAKEAHEYLPRD